MTRRFGPFTTRRIQQIVQGYREMAGITQPLHPHLFRHQMLTYLTSKGLTDAQISADFRPRKQKESRGLPTPVTQIGR
jgi:site-specific recombinase XerD